MHAQFWHDKWHRGEIGFHQPHPHPQLLRFWPVLGLAPGARVFLPLCGKSLDILWLLQQGHAVVGVELSTRAVDDLFDELGLVPEITLLGRLCHYRAMSLQPALEIWVGDIFDLRAELLGRVDAIYDRAALVALPRPMRQDYGKQLLQLGGGAPMLIVSLAYRQRLHQGPPFAVTGAEIQRHYAARYRCEQLANLPLDGGLKGQNGASETVWLLRPPAEAVGPGAFAKTAFGAPSVQPAPPVRPADLPLAMPMAQLEQLEQLELHVARARSRPRAAPAAPAAPARAPAPAPSRGGKSASKATRTPAKKAPSKPRG